RGLAPVPREPPKGVCCCPRRGPPRVPRALRAHSTLWPLNIAAASHGPRLVPAEAGTSQVSSSEPIQKKTTRNNSIGGESGPVRAPGSQRPRLAGEADHRQNGAGPHRRGGRPGGGGRGGV